LPYVTAYGMPPMPADVKFDKARAVGIGTAWTVAETAAVVDSSNTAATTLAIRQPPFPYRLSVLSAVAFILLSSLSLFVNAYFFIVSRRRQAGNLIFDARKTAKMLPKRPVRDFVKAFTIKADGIERMGGRRFRSRRPIERNSDKGRFLLMGVAMRKQGVLYVVAIVALATALVLGLFPPAPTPVGNIAEAAAFAKGADVSWVPGMEAQGYKWYDKNGVQRDILDILKNDYQINSVRIRVFVNPSNDYGNGYMNKDRAAALAQRAKNMGLRVMLTLHYSDTWADPGHQTKPAAWRNYTFQQLMDAVWNYTRDVMTTMQSRGVTPEWVQCGNETNDGMLWEDGRASANMRNYAWLVNTCNNAVKSISSSTKTVVHLANGYDNALFQWNIGGLISNGATFDVIGMSLYPSASDWQTKVNQAVSNMNDMISRYGKEVIVSEIGMDYNQASAAKSFIADIKTKTRNIANGKGLGVFYWEPEAYPGYNGGYNKGAWQSNGRPTIALEGFLN